MADLLKYRYMGARDANGLPTLFLSHPLHGAVPARDLLESDVALLHEDAVAYIEESPLYAKVTQSEARSVLKERSGEEPATDGNVSSPGLPEDQRVQVAPPGSAASGPTGELSAGPPTDAEAQVAVEQQAAAANPAIQDNPPVVRRGGKK